MRLDDLDPTGNARDLGSGGGGGGLGLLGFLPLLLGRGMGCGGIALIAIVVVGYLLFTGGGGLLSGGGTAPSTGGAAKACDTQEELFACRVMTSTEQVWGELSGGSYAAPTINFFKGGTQSGCGAASSAVGPFYCPSDRGIYIDTDFFKELDQRFGAKGDFARAYVIGHEVGHHIQTLDGTSQRVSQTQGQSSREEGNAQSVKLELQADCYAGVWAARSGRLEPGDIEEGMGAASAIGDDTIQGKQGEVRPESFTHGSAAERMRWLKRGLETGDPKSCDTFAGAN